ncbi:MAG: hypothetical protein KTR17_06790 [Cellvibrionaceae bacterium]|nr:hypothetical protein [Cellvibrionaceae bacterium]
MNSSLHLLRLICVCLLLHSLSACRAGFNTAEDRIDNPDLWVFTGAGSNWVLEVEKNGDGFELTRSNRPGSSVTITLTGTYEEFTNNGFTLLTVTDQSGTSDANSEITLVRASAYAAFLSPIFPDSSDEDDEDHEITPMVAAANCGSGDASSNWIRFKHPIDRQSAANEPNEFGTLTFDISAETLTLDDRYDIDAPTQTLSSAPLGSGECDDGYIDQSNQNTHYLGVDDSALLDLFNNDDDENQRLFAMDKSNIAANTDFDSDSYGILYDGATSGDRNFPIRADCVSGTCTINRVTDVEDGRTVSQGAYTLLLTNVNSPSTGFISGQIRLNSNPTQSQNAVCMLRSSATNQDILACVAKSPNNSAEMLNIFLVR